MEFFRNYFNKITRELNRIDTSLLERAVDLILEVNANGKKVIIAGNGASATIASHVSVDMTKCAKVRTINFNDAGLITCFSNDFGYERWVEKALEFYAEQGDVAILISSSGESMNIVNAAVKARDLGLSVITLSGFEIDNRLRQMGDVNLWVDSNMYNIVEAVHNVWLLSVIDKMAESDQKSIIGKETIKPIISITDKTFSSANKKVMAGGKQP